MTVSGEGSIVGSSGRLLRIIIRGESSLVTSVVGGGLGHVDLNHPF